MVTVPPEILGRIFELSVSPTSFQSFPERSRTLRGFSLVSQAFRQEAQRLLCSDAVYYCRRQGDMRSLTLYEVLRKEDSGLSVRSLRVDGTLYGSQKCAVPAGMEKCVSGSLRTLSLAHVTMDPDVIHQLPLLSHLSLHIVLFTPTSLSEQPKLSSITDLSLKQIIELPAALQLSQLPSLQRLAQRFATSNPNERGHYSFAQVLELQHQLDFLVCEYGDGAYRRQDISLIADFTLFDIPHYLFVGLREGDSDYTQNMHKVKHARLSFFQKLEGDRNQYGADGKFVPHRLERVLASLMPKLETLVVPSGWRESKMYEGFRNELERRAVVLLHEDEIYKDISESQISPAFREHRRRRWAASGGKSGGDSE